MSSSSDKFTQSRKTQKQMFLLVPSGHLCAPRRDINMMSPYKALSIWVKRFSEYLVYKLCHRPDSWRGFLHIYLLSFPRFWTFCIDWFAFLCFDDVTVKTQNWWEKKKKTVFLLSLRFVVSPQSPFCILYLWPWRNGIFLIKIVVSVSGTTQWRGSVSRHIWCLNIKTEMSIKWSLR